MGGTSKSKTTEGSRNETRKIQWVRAETTQKGGNRIKWKVKEAILITTSEQVISLAACTMFERGSCGE